MLIARRWSAHHVRGGVAARGRWRDDDVAVTRPEPNNLAERRTAGLCSLADTQFAVVADPARTCEDTDALEVDHPRGGHAVSCGSGRANKNTDNDDDRTNGSTHGFLSSSCRLCSQRFARTRHTSLRPEVFPVNERPYKETGTRACGPHPLPRKRNQQPTRRGATTASNDEHDRLRRAARLARGVGRELTSGSRVDEAPEGALSFTPRRVLRGRA